MREGMKAWLIGTAIVVVANIALGYYFLRECPAGVPAVPILEIYVFIPVIYLVLMYLALKNGRGRER